jgi:hypothetical protein
MHEPVFLRRRAMPQKKKAPEGALRMLLVFFTAYQNLRLRPVAKKACQVVLAS